MGRCCTYLRQSYKQFPQDPQSALDDRKSSIGNVGGEAGRVGKSSVHRAEL